MVVFPLVYYKEQQNPWVSYAKQQTLRKNNCINLICVGAPGSGKAGRYFHILI